MTNELIAILATGIALLGSIGAMWFSMQREIGGARSGVGGVRSGVGGLRPEVRDVRSEMSRLNSRLARIEGMLSALVARRTLLVQDPANSTGEIKKELAGFGMWKDHAHVRNVDTYVSETRRPRGAN